MPRFLSDDDLVEELMHMIESRNLSGILQAVADRCQHDRHMLIFRLQQTDPEAITYLSDEENILAITATMLKSIEERSAEREEQHREKKAP